MRQLASIQEVRDITPIENADAIETVHIQGWTVVCKKGIHFLGERVVFFEVDSFLPVKDEYEFLRASSFKNHPDLGEGFRLRTIKLRKQLSQGLVIPLPEEFKDLPVGTDLTDALGVKKWELPISAGLAGMVKGNFPSYLPKTEQDRAQNLIFDETFIQNTNYQFFEITEKLDGSSCTFYFFNGTAGVCSRNLELKLDQENNVFVNLAKESQVLMKMEVLNQNIALQGELCGPGIQGNIYGLKRHIFFLFDIFLIDEQRYATPRERFNLYSKHFFQLERICHVPELDNKQLVIDVFDPKKTLTELLTFAEGLSALNKVEREGLVWKSLDGSRISFKTISNRFLLKEK